MEFLKTVLGGIIYTVICLNAGILAVALTGALWFGIFWLFM